MSEKRVIAFFPRQLQIFLFFFKVSSGSKLFILHILPVKDKPENSSEGGSTPESLLWTCRLLPEEDVPEKQPAWIDQQGDEWVDQRSVKGVVQNSLGND